MSADLFPWCVPYKETYAKWKRIADAMGFHIVKTELHFFKKKGKILKTLYSTVFCSFIKKSKIENLQFSERKKSGRGFENRMVKKTV